MAVILLLGVGCLRLSAAPQRPWPDYQVIMWVSGKTVAHPAKHPLVLQRLREMGVTAGMVTGDGDPSLWTGAQMPYYVENIVRTGLCLKFRSPVTEWSKFVNQWMETRDESAFIRPYCLEDPAWLAESKKHLQKVVGIHKPNGPLLYDLRDELSITISANPFDYDFSPQSLDGFRKWLQSEYGSLEALNKQWDTDFPSWEAVKPFSTDQIKRRMVTGERMPKGPPDDWSALKHIKFDPLQAAKAPAKWNFSPWCDFRTYMDTVLARTLDTLRQAAHEVDSATPVGIEGAQMPHAFGGYDLWKLSQSVDWMEPYDVANSREILGDFMPGKPLYCTLFEKDTDHAMRRLWHLLLLGDKGCIVWWSEDCIDTSKPDCPLTDKAKALAPVFREMQSPLAKLFMLAKRETDPIAIHYSQASIQVAWLLESVADGKTWPRRFSSFEADHSRHAAVRNGWLKLLQDLGYTPRFVSTEQIEKGALEQGGCRVLALPESLALSQKAAEAVVGWNRAVGGNKIIATNSAAGIFDQHGMRRSYWPAHWIAVNLGTGYAQSEFSILFQSNLPDEDQFNGGPLATGGYADGDIATYPLRRMKLDVEGSRKGPSEYEALSEQLRQRNSNANALYTAIAGKELSRSVALAVRLPSELAIRTHRYRLSDTARLLAFERGVDYHMSEDLKQAGGNEPLEKPVSFTAKLAGKVHAYDLRSGAYLGEVEEIVVNLDPWKPSLFALLPNRLPEGRGVVEALLSQAAEFSK